MRAAILFALASCQAPDRYHVTAGSALGDVDGPRGGDWDEEEVSLELGVSGPLFGAPEPVRPRLAHEPIAPLPAAPAPSDGGLPWTELAILLGGAAGLKGGEIGYRKMRSRKESK